MKKICFAVYFILSQLHQFYNESAICNVLARNLHYSIPSNFILHKTLIERRKLKEMFIQLISTYLIFSICTTLIQFLEENNFFNKFYLPACLSNNVLRTWFGIIEDKPNILIHFQTKNLIWKSCISRKCSHLTNFQTERKEKKNIQFHFDIYNYVWMSWNYNVPTYSKWKCQI